MRFTEWFWGTSVDPTLGIRKLHTRLLTDVAQVEELVALITQRIAIEESYASKLGEVARKPLRPDGFGQDESLMTSIFTTYRTEMAHLAGAHKNLADLLQQVLGPLQRFLEDARRICFPKKDAIDNYAKSLDAARVHLAQIHQSYMEKCQTAILELKLYDNSPSRSDLPPTLDVLINMGPKAFTVDEFNDFITRMQWDIECKDIPSLLGAYKDCYSSDDIVRYVKKRLQITNIESERFISDLVANNFIKAVSTRPVLYQWKRTVFDVQHELPHKRAAREATRAEFEYRKAVKSAESVRQSLDVACADYMRIMQAVLYERLRTVKDALVSCVEVEKVPVPVIRSIQERVLVFLETLDADKEIQLLVERDRTGVRPTMPHVFVDFHKGPSQAIYGIELDLLSSRTGCRVPPLMRKCLKYVGDVYTEQVKESKKSEPTAKMLELDAWLQPIDELGTMHLLRNELNTGFVRRKTLRKYPPEIIIGAMKVFLMELPTSVCSEDVYEPLKLLYLSKADDVGGMRLNSLRNLLATMSSAHFHTLAFLVEHLHGLIAGLDASDPKVADLSTQLGPYLLRPKTETAVSVLDKHRARLVRDLLLHYEELISPDLLSPSNSNEDLPDDVNPRSPTDLDGSDLDADLDEDAESHPWNQPLSIRNRLSVSTVTSSHAGSDVNTSPPGADTQPQLRRPQSSSSFMASYLRGQQQQPAATQQQPQTSPTAAGGGATEAVSRRVSSSWFLQAPDLKSMFGTATASSQPPNVTASASSAAGVSPISAGSAASPSDQRVSRSGSLMMEEHGDLVEFETKTATAARRTSSLSLSTSSRVDVPKRSSTIGGAFGSGVGSTTHAETTTSLFEAVLSDESDIEVFGGRPSSASPTKLYPYT
ncbi:hypothetical protein BC831DRAFT_443776 [Entophlyctis helioformis]|nr:hypothetical protein BC831DRAFT_443776 [Entophlyctis helioformis]